MKSTLLGRMDVIASRRKLLGVVLLCIAGGLTSRRPSRVGTQSATPGTGTSIERIVISVADFGARGDGSTDEHDAFHRAIDAATGPRTVHVPKGRYLLTASVILPDDVTLQGEGEQSILITAPGSNINLVTNAGLAGGARNLAVADLRLEGNHDEQNDGSCLAFQNVTGGTIKNVHAVDGRVSNFLIRACANIRIEDAVAEGAGNDNVIVYDGSANVDLVRIRAGTSRGSAGVPGAPAISAGFEVADDSHDINILDCEAHENAHDGLTIHNHSAEQVGRGTTGPRSIAVRRFRAVRNRRHGLNVLAQSINGPDGIVLEEITIEESAKAALNIDGTDGNPVGEVRVVRLNARRCGNGLRVAAPVALTCTEVIVAESTSFGVNLRPTLTGTFRLEGVTCLGGADYGVLCAAAGVELASCNSSQNQRGGFFVEADFVTLRACVANDNTRAPEKGDGVGFDILGNSCVLEACAATGNELDGVRIRNVLGTIIRGGNFGGNSRSAIREVGNANGTCIDADVAVGDAADAIVLSGERSRVSSEPACPPP